MKIFRVVFVVVSLFIFSTFPAVSSESININIADIETLSNEIKGVGPVRARAIVEYRELHGPFASVDELVVVKGIGEKSLAKYRDRLVALPLESSE